MPDDDDACWDVAEQINQGRPQWLVVWGCYSRRFVAFPLFDTRRRLRVYAGYPDALVERMDEAERRYRIRPGRKGADDYDRDGE